MQRDPIHLALAGYLSSDDAVRQLAKRVKRRTKSPSLRRAMNLVINFELSASELVRRVYWERVDEKNRKDKIMFEIQ